MAKKSIKKSFRKKPKFKSREDLLNKAFVCPPEKGYMKGGKCIPHKKAKKPKGPSLKESTLRVLKKAGLLGGVPIKPKKLTIREKLVKEGILSKKSKKKK
jgi:hypothetical protein|tara:strand:- start:2852 stop:3151 length:300 start_codon:yes stop_codon:yes gene_type:complete